MILIPQKLFADNHVQTLLRQGNVCILSKTLETPIQNREGYITNHVVSMVLAGEQQITTYENQRITIKAGEMVFIPRGLYYISDLLPKAGPFKSLLFYFDDEIIQSFLANTKVTDIVRRAAPEFLKFDMVPSINLYADAVLTIYRDHAIQDKAFLKPKILELLYLLNSQIPEQSFANFLFRLTLPKKRSIKSFMDQNFDKPLKIEDYAYLTGRSLSTFRRDFKASYEMTPQKWLLNRRLEKAIRILDQKEVSVTELAFEVGYENISYFIKAFKDKVGHSPKQYMLAKHRNKMN